MSYEKFSTAEIGDVIELASYLSNQFCLIRFVKMSSTMWLVDLDIKCDGFSDHHNIHFTQCLSSIEASCLFDTYDK